MNFSFSRLISLVLLSSLMFQSTLSVSAYTYSNQYSSTASSVINNYISRLQNSGYTTSEIVKNLTDLRSVYLKRKSSGQYTGIQLQKIDAVIDKLDERIASYSSSYCTTCDVYDSFNTLPSRNQYYDSSYYNNTNRSNGYYLNGVWYSYNNSYSTQYQNYNSQNYYNYNSSSYSQVRTSVNSTSLLLDTYYTTQARTNISIQNLPYQSTYDVYTFTLQDNGYSNSQPNSSRFLTTTQVRSFDTAQNRTLSVFFGNEYSSDRVRSIRSLAESSYKSSLTYTTLSSSFYDSYTALSRDEFARYARGNTYSKSYNTYKLYIARDNSNAFIIEYNETGASDTYYYQNILGLDVNSFSDSSSTFYHNYTTSSNTMKRYRQYVYIPSRGSSPSSVHSTLGISYKTTLQSTTQKTLTVYNDYTTTTINGFRVTDNSISSLQSTFAQYVNPIYVDLPGSYSQFAFSPLSRNNFYNEKLSDNTYRMYRLLVAEDGTDAYLTEYIQKEPNYYY